MISNGAADAPIMLRQHGTSQQSWRFASKAGNVHPIPLIRGGSHRKIGTINPNAHQAVVSQADPLSSVDERRISGAAYIDRKENMLFLTLGFFCVFHHL
ncbi:hypothetical protein [Parageobacillus thermoglucosidasius]|uniref:Uncharacterized protein n=1 Tax=Parageobacillus thermoglucosidasius TaxID=1426 RepID=A0AAN0YPG9_PARTM|nr:hypothetical protein [Parageobacillus thermoglucosidasius]ALF10528.1 hypothetical protein AOT13_11175 [Parageobacillus thermoglucosidasius]ANZ30606.1 hypothetical protein BCV53_11185 [Parageobacillus thermoglucosidasius]APM81345.1 hypothetical protein BCV54_11200 [Parageobacillus thermoglucosidasius]KJX67719.1 hypothetical protein WH82_16370 [Parageobacillus thermoglucosidasius]RDE21934.1 hypothetical protein DV712_17885 [Parageobacillus thermoglucosidasius]